jgi:hypothetical protein
METVQSPAVRCSILLIWTLSGVASVHMLREILPINIDRGLLVFKHF